MYPAGELAVLRQLLFINFYFFDLDFPGLISIKIDTLWVQLLLEFSTDPGLISVRIDTLWVQLLLEFSTDHF